jgi:hypothetical protein
MEMAVVAGFGPFATAWNTALADEMTMDGEPTPDESWHAARTAPTVAVASRILPVVRDIMGAFPRAL